jgi:hypothetical protein
LLASFDVGVETERGAELVIGFAFARLQEVGRNAADGVVRPDFFDDD